MAIQVKCACGRTVNVRDELSGLSTACLYCGKAIQVPGSAVAPPAPEPTFALLPPILDHLNLARRFFGRTPRAMPPALRDLINLAMTTLRADALEPDLALDEITKAVRDNPLAAGYVVRPHPSHLKAGGARAPAAVVFATDPLLTFDVAYLERVGKKVIEVGHTRRNPAVAAVQAPFDDVRWAGCMAVPEGAGASPNTWLGAMVINPKELPMGHLATPFVAGIACPALKHFVRTSLLQV
jgi:hypothetical protein